MENEGPILETLARRLAETPVDFLAEPLFGKTGEVDAAAVVSDLLRELGGPPLTADELAQFCPKDRRQHRNRLRAVLISAWLLADPWFRSQPRYTALAREFLKTGLEQLAALVKAADLTTDADRREELARLCLKALGLCPAGETAAQAEDRLMTLSLAERERVIHEGQAAEERARQIREAMAAAAAQEATATYSSG